MDQASGDRWSSLGPLGTRQKACGSVLLLERVDHEDKSHHWPPLLVAWKIDMEVLGRLMGV